MSTDQPYRGRYRYNAMTGELESCDVARKIEVDAPFVKTDEIEPTMSHASGKTYTSKAMLRKDYKDHGVVECYGEKPVPIAPPTTNYDEIRETVQQSMNDARWGNVKFSEKEKEMHLREQRAFEEYKKRR